MEGGGELDLLDVVDKGGFTPLQLAEERDSHR
jgi:hypothetical protein